MAQELTATSNRVAESAVNIKMNVAESRLPVQGTRGGNSALFGSNEDAGKDLNYSSDQRNPKLVLQLKCEQPEGHGQRQGPKE